MTKTDL